MAIFSILTADSPFLDELAEMIHLEWGNDEKWSRITQVKELLLQRINSFDKEFVLVAVADENKPLGTASVMLYELDDKPERRYWMGEVVIRPEARGQGLGTLIVKEIIAHSEKLNIPELFLYTPDQQALYKKQGWQEIERRQVYNDFVSVMQRPITSN